MSKTPLEYAYEFIRYNIPVFPLMTGQKKPYPGTKGFYDATTDEEQIKTWSLQYPNCNWGMPTGSRSGITALDIDPRNGGEESMSELIEQNGLLPATPAVATAGGGWHYYFRVPSIARIRNGKISDGIDIKTDGGYVVIPGSWNQETDAYYEWVEEQSLFELEVNDMPGWIVSMLNRKNNFDIDDDGFIGEGQRNIYLTSIAGTLRRRGATAEAILACLLEMNKDRCNPPLPEHEIHTISESMMKYEPEHEMIKRFMNAAELDLNVFGDAIESQETLIGYLLREDKTDELVNKIFDDIKHDQLIDPDMSAVFKTMHKMYLSGVTLTYDNIQTALGDVGFDPADYAKFGFNVIHISDISFHANRILNAWMLRKANAIFTFAAESSKTGRREAKNIVGEAITSLMEVMDRGEEKRIMSARDAVRSVRFWMDNATEDNAPYTKYNLPWLDDFTDGAEHGEIVVVAARPSQGKTAFMLKLAASMCRGDEAAVIFSAEMATQKLMSRMISTKAKVNSRELKYPWRMSVPTRRKVDEASAFIEDNYNLFIDDTANPTPQYMMAKTLAINSKTPVKVVFVDFLELVGIDSDDAWAKGNKVLRLEQAMINLKILAKTLGIPVIVLSQVGRDVVNRATKSAPPVPRSTDLRWSGMIEQLANQILMLYYPWFFWNDGVQFAEVPPEDYYEIHVVKNRDGRVGTIPLNFIKQYGDFVANDFTGSGEVMDFTNKVGKEDLPWKTDDE